MPKTRVVRFVTQAEADDRLLMRFTDPSGCFAVEPGSGLSAGGEALEIVYGAVDVDAQVVVKVRGMELGWSPGRCSIRGEAAQTEEFVGRVVGFAHYEGELRRLEGEIAGAWESLDEDRSLTFEVTKEGLRRSGVVKERMMTVLRQRMRLARIEPHLLEASDEVSEAAEELGAKLREGARVEARMEALSGHIEVFEDVYEMASQRMGEQAAANEGHRIEWIIIAILALEAMVMVSQMIWGNDLLRR